MVDAMPLPSSRASSHRARGPLAAIRRRLVKTAFAEPVDLHGKTMVVTGAAEGSLGFETARMLARWGALVAVTTRAETDAVVVALQETLDQDAAARVDGHPLDLSNRASVAEFANWVNATYPDGIDVLVNNAGVHLDLLSRWREPRLSEDGHELQWRINYLGTMQLTEALLPALARRARATGDARIVNVVSHLHKRGANTDLFGATRPYESWNAYGNSKLALIHATNELQRRYADAGLQAYCLHPGAVCTNVAARGLEEAPALQSLRNALLSVESFFLKTPKEGAQTQVYCATHPRLPGGLYYQECEPLEPSRECQDSEVAGRLWDETLCWVRG